MSEAKAMCAPQKPAPNESPVEGCWRMIGLANQAAALGVDVGSIQWARRGASGSITVQLDSREDVDRLADETGCDETTWGDNAFARPSDGRLERLYYRRMRGLKLWAATPVEVVEADRG